MGQESLEAAAFVVAFHIVVVAGEPVDAITSEGGTARAKSFFVNLFHTVGEMVGGAHVVLHAQATVVAADLLAPLRAEANGATAVGRDDEVAATAHHHEVPARAPELTHH